MNIKQLSYFVNVAKTQNYTRSASELFISQPTLCASIYKLEDELGIKLFQPKGRNIVLTEDGDKLLTYAKALIEHYNHFEQRAYAIAHPDKGRLSVGIPSGIAHYVLSEGISEFCKLYPNVQLNLICEGAKKVHDLVVAGELDCGVSMGQVHSSLESTAIVQDELILIVPYNNSRLNCGRSIMLNELVGEKLILLGEDTVVYHKLNQSFSDIGVEPNVVMTSSEVDFILDMVRAGQGATIQSHMIVKEANTSGLVLVPLNDGELVWDIQLVRRKNSVSSLTHLFCDFMTQYCRTRSGIKL